MSIKTNTTAAAAIAALALPTVALGHDVDKNHGHGNDRSEQRSENRSDRAVDKRTSQARKAKSRAFVVRGVDVASLPVEDGKLTGALTLDPTSANKHARTFLELTRTELRGEDTVTFGDAGDAVVTKFVGLKSTDALQPTDVVKVIGKVTRTSSERKAKAASADGQDDRTLNIRKIMVIRPSEETASKTTSTAKHRD